MPTNTWSALGSSLGQAFGGGGSFQKGQLDGAHMAAYESTAALNRAKAEEVQRRAQYQNPANATSVGAAFAGLSDGQGKQVADFQRDGHWGMKPAEVLPEDVYGPAAPSLPNKVAPDWATPQTLQRVNQGRGAFLANLGGTGDSNAEQMAKAFAELAGQGRIDGALSQSPQALNTLQSAMKGNLYDFKEFGTGDNATGKVAFNQPYVDKNRSEIGKNSAAAANSYASAGEHKAGAELKRSKIGAPTLNPDGSITNAPAPKPMPAPALKMQQEALDIIGTASGMNGMLDRFTSDIEQGKLNLGPIRNMASKAKNYTGASDESSRNFASFQSTLERIRNDSLRLNKGVQTDGDAQRAWNELLTNINDPEVVKQRLSEIKQLNERAVNLQKLNVDQIRRNYGHQSLDTTGYQSGIGGTAGNANIDALLNKYGNP